MGIKSPRELLHLFKELAELKRNYSDIKPLLKDFYSSDNPRETLEKILDAAKRNPVLDDLFKISKTYDMISRAEENAKEKGWNHACLEAVKEMGVKNNVIGEENIPDKGSTLYISNHPYGLLDSAILIGNLGSLLEKKGQEMKLIGMDQLRLIKGIEEVVYFVNSTNRAANKAYLRGALNYLNNEGNLVIYPSGTISGANLREYEWQNGINHFLSHSSYVTPIWFSGPGHEAIYNLLARREKTKRMRNLFSLRSAWNKNGKEVVLKIGLPIPSEYLMDIKDGKERVEYLRRCAENLKVKI